MKNENKMHECDVQKSYARGSDFANCKLIWVSKTRQGIRYFICLIIGCLALVWGEMLVAKKCMQMAQVRHIINGYITPLKFYVWKINHDNMKCTKTFTFHTIKLDWCLIFLIGITKANPHGENQREGCVHNREATTLWEVFRNLEWFEMQIHQDLFKAIARGPKGLMNQP